MDEAKCACFQFLPGRTVLEGGGTFDVPSIAAAKGSPLAKLLFRFGTVVL